MPESTQTHSKPLPDPHLILEQALELHQRGELNLAEEALASFDGALELEPHREDARLQRGDVLVRLGRLEEALDNYVQALPSATAPHLLNERIHDLEIKLGRDQLASFPPLVFLNFNKLCNAGCLLCHMPEVKTGLKDAVQPQDLERMTWLRYVRELGIFGGFGESLINPFFADNLAMLRKTYPHLQLILWTNGIAITEELCSPLAEGLACLNISLNAATASTWEKTMGGAKGFERICHRLKTISAIKARNRTAYPRISLSTVLLQENVHELPAMVDLARELGAEEVVVQHYSTHESTVGQTKAAASSSMYQDRERCDHFLQEASARALALGIRTSFPLPFGAKACAIEAGSRVDHPPTPCLSPWKTLLHFDELEPGLRQACVCCTGPFYLSAYRKEELTEAGLRALWNHPNLRFSGKLSTERAETRFAAGVSIRIGSIPQIASGVASARRWNRNSSTWMWPTGPANQLDPMPSQTP